MNLVEKIASRFVVPPRNALKVGELVALRPVHVLTHDHTSSAIVGHLRGMRAKIFDRSQPVLAVDRHVQDHTPAARSVFSSVRAFAKKHELDFFSAGSGIGHQLLLEEGYSLPGSLVVATDSNAAFHGSVGCLSTPVLLSDAVAIWLTGQMWWRIPPVIRVHLEGTLPPHVSAKDLALKLSGLIGAEARGAALEFSGNIGSLSIPQRCTVAAHAQNCGAVSSLFPADEVTVQWFHTRVAQLSARGPVGSCSDPALEEEGAHRNYLHPRLNPAAVVRMYKGLAATDRSLQPDVEAEYAGTFHLDMSCVDHTVLGPHSDTKAEMLPENGEVRITKAFLMSCLGSQASQIKEAAAVIDGYNVAESVEFYVSPASATVQREVEASGDWDRLLIAGARPLPSGCNLCAGLGKGALQSVDVAVSTSATCARGRMGAFDTSTFLASPSVVAASAVAGFLVSPEWVHGNIDPANPWVTREDKLKAASSGKTPQTNKVPSRWSGKRFEVVEKEDLWRPLPSFMVQPLQDCLSKPVTAVEVKFNSVTSDQLFPARQLAVSEEEKLGAQPFASALSSLEAPFVIVGGDNFGCGSWREETVASLRNAGVMAIVCTSAAPPLRRACFNLGLPLVEGAALAREWSSWMDTTATVGVDNSTALTARTALSRLDLTVACREHRERDDVAELGWVAHARGDTAKELPLRVPDKLACEFVLSGGLLPFLAQNSYESLV